MKTGYLFNCYCHLKKDLFNFEVAFSLSSFFLSSNRCIIVSIKVNVFTGFFFPKSEYEIFLVESGLMMDNKFHYMFNYFLSQDSAKCCSSCSCRWAASSRWILLTYRQAHEFLTLYAFTDKWNCCMSRSIMHDNAMFWVWGGFFCYLRRIFR